jgi:hypothetical protein
MQQVGNRDDNPLCHRTRGMQLVTRLYRLAGSRILPGPIQQVALCRVSKVHSPAYIRR